MLCSRISDVIRQATRVVFGRASGAKGPKIAESTWFSDGIYSRRATLRATLHISVGSISEPSLFDFPRVVALSTTRQLPNVVLDV